MRIFEILLLLSIIYILFSLLFPKFSNTKILLTISGISILLLIIHLIVEGFRWQMFILYFITVLFSAISLYSYFKKPANKKRPKLLIFSYVLLAVFIFLSTVLSVYIPVFKIPEPTGLFNVGTQTLYFIDESREEVYTNDKNDKRELMVQVWYPAQNTKGKKLSNYVPGGKKMITAQSEKEYNIPEIFLDYLKYIKSNSYEEAEISSSVKTYPIIFLNHGLGTNGFNHTSLAENLASNGYVVAAIDFTHSTAATIFPNGKITYDNAPTNTPELKNNLAKVWTEDIEFIINQFEKINSGDIKSIFKGKIDFNNIGVCGYSFGGGASFLVHNSDSRIKAGVNLDGSLIGYENMKTSDISTKPFLTMLDEQQWNKRSMTPTFTDGELKKMNTTREAFGEGMKIWTLENDLIKQTVKNGGYEIYIKNTDHYNFTDFQLYSSLPSLVGIQGIIGKINGERGNYIVNQYVVDFFNKYLKNKGGDLLKGPNKEYPEVNFEYYK